MRKASRLFEIIQILRLSRGPVTAETMAARLGVTMRSIYRDIDALKAMRVPIAGERGLGYILRPGFELPPLMLTDEEIEAVVIATAMLERTGDGALAEAAQTVRRKLAGAVPEVLRGGFSSNALHAWGLPAPRSGPTDLGELRRAIRDERKLRLDYEDEAGRRTDRVVRPVALIYYPQTANLVAWCEMRSAIRNFRQDRMLACELLEDRFAGEGDGLRALWVAGWTATSAPT